MLLFYAHFVLSTAQSHSPQCNYDEADKTHKKDITKHEMLPQLHGNKHRNQCNVPDKQHDIGSAQQHIIIKQAKSMK